MHRNMTDPATLPAGTRVTVIRYVTGNAVQRLDESEYRYPTIEVRHLYAWAPDTYERRRYSQGSAFSVEWASDLEAVGEAEVSAALASERGFSSASLTVPAKLP